MLDLLFSYWIDYCPWQSSFSFTRWNRDTTESTTISFGPAKGWRVIAWPLGKSQLAAGVRQCQKLVRKGCFKHTVVFFVKMFLLNSFFSVFDFEVFADHCSSWVQRIQGTEQARGMLAISSQLFTCEWNWNVWMLWAIFYPSFSR